MRARGVFPLIGAAAAIAAALGAHRSAAPVKTTDQLAWQTLAEVSTPTQSPGAAPGETPVSWRLWWNYQDVYPHQPGPNSPQQTNTAAKFRNLPCQPESERKLFSPSEQSADPCEVIWLNGVSAGYVFANKFWLREYVIQRAVAGQISFPMSPAPIAIEMKTEWRPMENRHSGRYVTGVDGKETRG